jgi:superfamily I DNA and RNA helicase
MERALSFYAGDAPGDAGPGPEGVRQLIDLLSPSRDVPRPLGLAMSQESQQILHLTEEQFYLLDVLGAQRRVAISGCAGSGKTTLALEQARRLGEQGFRVLLACFNTHVVEFFGRQRLPEGVTIAGFHQLCLDKAAEAGLTVKQSASEPLADYLARFPELLWQAADCLGPQYDALIVDEGQDFEAEWWLPLQRLLLDPDRSLMYVFYDDTQNL